MPIPIPFWLILKRPCESALKVILAQVTAPTNAPEPRLTPTTVPLLTGLWLRVSFSLNITKAPNVTVAVATPAISENFPLLASDLEGKEMMSNAGIKMLTNSFISNLLPRSINLTNTTWALTWNDSNTIFIEYGKGIDRADGTGIDQAFPIRFARIFEPDDSIFGKLEYFWGYPDAIFKGGTDGSIDSNR